MKVKKTFWAKIALGFREGYSSKVHTMDEVYKTCHEYCDKVGLCVTITPTTFIYSKGKGIADGYEDGCFIELINYPRFPQSKYDVVGLAIDLAKIFLKDFSQQRISIIATDNTYLVEQNDLKTGA